VTDGPSRRAFLRGLALRAAATRVGPIPDGEPAPAPPPPPPREPDGDPRRAPSPFTLGDEEVERYSRQLVLPGWNQGSQLRLRDANVLVVGAGALGSPVCLYLVGAGVGRLGVVDDDDVELSNLHRQPLYLTPDVGYPKAHSAAAKLGVLNPGSLIEPYMTRFEESNAEALVLGQDLVIDCSDSFETRYVVNAACCAAGIPLIEGGATGFEGLVMSIRPGRSACYRCAFPQVPDPASTPSCAQAGVLGPAAGVIGSLMALEALRLLGGLEPELLDAFLAVDLMSLAFTRVAVRRMPDCPDCGGE
jgi:molybdopterin/thiamine biosynthesis adenylyltransferase